MNLAEALGVISWRDIRCESVQIDECHELPEAMFAAQDELWCWDAELSSFWDDEADSRWLLLIAIVRALGYSQETLLPLDAIEDAPKGAKVLAFGLQEQQTVHLPTLSKMLTDARLKKQVWQALCTHGYLVTP